MSSSQPISRRSFVVGGAALAAGAAAACLPEVDGRWLSESAALCSAPEPRVEPGPAAQAGRVLELEDSGLVLLEGTPRLVEERVAAGLEQLLLALTGRADLAQAWASLLPGYAPGQTVGIKVNTLNRGVPTHLEVVRPLVESLKRDAKIPGEQILVWDRRLDELTRAGLTAAALGCRVEGTTDDAATVGSGRGYELNPTCFGGKTTHLSNIQTRAVDHLLNVAVMKNHRASGFTGVLKNHYGTFDNPGDFHDRPGSGGAALEPWFARAIPAVNALDEVAGKARLWILDATIGVARGDTDGPADCAPAVLLAGLDPVAMDCRGRQIRDRAAAGAVEDSVSESWLEASERAGLGQRTIKLEQVTS